MYTSALTFVLGAQKNCLIETIFLSTPYNIYFFGWEIRKLIFHLLVWFPNFPLRSRKALFAMLWQWLEGVASKYWIRQIIITFLIYFTF